MWELIQCSQAAAAAARAAGKSWRRTSQAEPDCRKPEPPKTRNWIRRSQRNGISFVWRQGGMCTSYPSCHRMFGLRQPWESSPRAPRSHRAQHLYSLVHFIMTAGRPRGKFDMLCTMNFGFCLVVRLLFPKVFNAK